VSIKLSEIEVGYVFSTENYQERLVLKITKEDKVQYVSRSGKIKNPWNDFRTCKKETFAKACKIKGKKKSEKAFNEQFDKCKTMGLLK
jgi:hypothetical protein